MSNSKITLAALFALLLMTYSCNKESPGAFGDLSRSFISTVGCTDTTTSFAPLNYSPGSVTTDSVMVDTARSFKMYVPTSYDSTEAYPLVIMFHGTNQNAQIMINKTSWNQEAETEGFVVLYPNALKYLLGGVPTSKWRTEGALLAIDFGQIMRDDLSFVRDMIKKTYGTLNINCNKIYACGFSNGGGFVKSELRIHMDNTFAATGNMGGMGLQTSLVPDHGLHMPHFEVLGTMDANKLAICSLVELPDDSVNIVAEPCVMDRMETMRISLNLDVLDVVDEVYGPLTIEYADFHYKTSFLAQNTEYRFRMIKGLIHKIPSKNWTTDYVPIFWDFFKAF